ncbi:MAG: M48 family metalloprotease, partial [Gallionella sp.]
MKIMTLTLLLCLSPYTFSEGLPDLGDISQTVLTPTQERQIGQQSMMQIRASQQYLDDVEVNDYLNQIGYKLVENSAQPSLEFEFFAINDNNINAFAMPGGFIGVNSGLLILSQSESELAAVLSHEIAHVTQHHLARIIAGQQTDGLTALAALAVAILASRTNPQAAEAAILSVQAHSIQKQLDFTRIHELEADRIGLDILAKSEFSIHAMPDFLSRLQSESRLLDGSMPTYLRTHPITSDRIADIENRVARQPYRLIPDSLDFQLVRAKLIAGRKKASDAVNYFKQALGDKKHGNPIVQHYGLVVSLLRNNQPALAATAFKRLRKEIRIGSHSISSPLIESLAGQVMLAEKRTSDAQAFYQAAVMNFPQSRALLYAYAELLLNNNQADTAIELVTEQLLQHPSDTKLYA